MVTLPQERVDEREAGSLLISVPLNLINVIGSAPPGRPSNPPSWDEPKRQQLEEGSLISRSRGLHRAVSLRTWYEWPLLGSKNVLMGKASTRHISKSSIPFWKSLTSKCSWIATPTVRVCERFVFEILITWMSKLQSLSVTNCCCCWALRALKS